MLKQTKSFALPYANAYDYCVSIRNNNQDHERQIPENGRVDALNQGTTCSSKKKKRNNDIYLLSTSIGVRVLSITGSLVLLPSCNQ